MTVVVVDRVSPRVARDAESLIEVYRETGDRRSVEKLLEMHRSMLGHLAGRYSVAAEDPYEDLLQVAYVGLTKAIWGYRADSGARFGSYAYTMVEGEIRHHLRDAGLVKKPRWARSLYSQMSGATTRLTAKLGRPPTVEEVAEEINLKPDGIAELMKLFNDTNVSSLDEAAETGVDLSAIKSLHHETFSLPIEDRIQLEQALASLSEIQRKVVYLFFYKDLTQTEIGRRLGLPQRKISRLVASSLRSLKGAR